MLRLLRLRLRRSVAPADFGPDWWALASLPHLAVAAFCCFRSRLVVPQRLAPQLPPFAAGGAGGLGFRLLHPWLRRSVRPAAKCPPTHDQAQLGRAASQPPLRRLSAFRQWPAVDNIRLFLGSTPCAPASRPEWVQAGIGPNERALAPPGSLSWLLGHLPVASSCRFRGRLSLQRLAPQLPPCAAGGAERLVFRLLHPRLRRLVLPAAFVKNA